KAAAGFKHFQDWPHGAGQLATHFVGNPNRGYRLLANVLPAHYPFECGNAIPWNCGQPLCAVIDGGSGPGTWIAHVLSSLFRRASEPPGWSRRCDLRWRGLAPRLILFFIVAPKPSW